MTTPPALILIIGGLLLPLLPKSSRPLGTLLLPLLTLWAAWDIHGQTNFDIVQFAGFDLIPIHIHPFTLTFATVFSLAAFAGALFSINKKQKIREISTAFVYSGSAIGVTFAGDFITLFIYWEIMAIASTILILFGGTKEARKSSLRYAFMHFLGGVILLIGITAYISANNSIELKPLFLDFGALVSAPYIPLEMIASAIIITGFLVNAGAPPFSSWIPDSYPESSPVGAVFLSAFTTKTAVFVLLTLFAGTKFLIFVGLFMIFYGIIYAMLENDMRRILSYSIVNQVGFMVTGVGIGTEMAQLGVAAHAFCHIIYKALLFMSAGSVLYMTGKRKCTELGGLYRTMKLTTICGIIGAISISAFPWTSGFVSKSMISSSAAILNMEIVWLLFLAASAGVFLHAGIKFPWFVFFQKDSGLRPHDPPWGMRLAMLLLSALCILPGIFPEYLYQILPYEVTYIPYTGDHIVTQLQLLLFAGLAFFVMLPMLQRTKTISLDFDWITRVPIRSVLLLLEKTLNNIVNLLESIIKGFVKKTQNIAFHLHNSEGILGRSWTLGSTVLFTTILLCIFLILYYSR